MTSNGDGVYIEAMAKSESVSARVEPEVIQRLDRLAVELTKRAEGVEVNRSDAARTTILAGLEALESKLGLVPKKGAQRKP